MKKLILTVGVAMFLVACQDDAVEKESSEKNTQIEISTEEKNLSIENRKLNAEKDNVVNDFEGKKSLESDTIQFETFDFLSLIQIVEVKESNTSAVKEKSQGGLSTTKASYDSEVEKFFIYGDIRNPEYKRPQKATENSNKSEVVVDKEENEIVLEKKEIPKWTINENTSMIVVEDVSSLGTLVYNSLNPTENSSFKSKLSPINKEMVENKNRLFLNSNYAIKKLENGVVELTLEGKKHLINPGESFKEERENNNVTSTFEVFNYGVLDSSVDIMFEDPTGKFFENEDNFTGKGLYDSMNEKELKKLIKVD